MTIKRYHHDLTVEEILIRSGNVGSVRIGQKLEIDRTKIYFLGKDRHFRQE